MSKATWVVQSNKLKTGQTLPLIQALKKLGEPFQDIGLDNEGIISPIDLDRTDYIPFGSTALVLHAERYKWQHLFFDRATFRTNIWQRHRADMLNPSLIMTLEEAARYADDEDVQYFIRPVEDLKAFHGHVIRASELRQWVQRLAVGDCELTVQELVALSTPKTIQMEWRYLIVGGKVITGSSYRHLGKPHRYRDDDFTEVQAMADVWLPHPCCCMDVALVDDVPKVIEFNCLNATGFYDHDIEALVTAVSAYVNGQR